MLRPSYLKQQKDLKTNRQAGQTLVETMVASLVLVLGIGAAVTLSIYGLGATSSVSKQLVAIGLAREGIEAVKNMRDTNWLRATMVTSCYNFYTGQSNAGCYPDWLNATSGSIGGYNIEDRKSTRLNSSH